METNSLYLCIQRAKNMGTNFKKNERQHESVRTSG